MGKYILNSMYLKARWRKADKVNPYSDFNMEKISDDCLIQVIKDDETNTSEVQIIERPTIEYYTVIDEQNCTKYNQMYIDRSLVEPHTVEYSKREGDICKYLGIYDEYKRLKAEANKYHMDPIAAKMDRDNFKRFMNQKVYMSPLIYEADLAIEDYYKTAFMKKHGSKLPRILNISYYDIETFIYRFKEQVDQNNPLAPISIITYYNNKQNHFYALVLFLDEIRQVQMEVQSDIDAYINEYIKEDFEKIPDCKINIKFFESERTMLQAFHQLIQQDKPDFAMAWNSNYDNKYMLGREKILGLDIPSLWCHPDIPEQYRQFSFFEDPQRKEKVFNAGDDSGNKKHFSRLWDWIVAPGPTTYIDQMSLYSNLRKRSIERSYKLDAIAEKEIHANKVDLADFGYNIRNAIVKDFKIFLKYSMRDTALLHLLEERNHDLITYLSLADNTDTKNGVNVSIIIKNAFYNRFLDNDQVMGNTIDYGIKESIDGALVQDPLLLEVPPVEINGHKTKIFRNVVDWDAKSLYPSLMCQHQIGRENQRYRILNITDQYGNFIMSGQDYNQYLQTKDVSIIDLCHDLYDLPNLEDIIADVENKIVKACAVAA